MLTCFELADLGRGHRAAALRDVFARVPGVRAVEVDVAARRLSVDFDERALGADHLMTLLAALGHEVVATTGVRPQ